MSHRFRALVPRGHWARGLAFGVTFVLLAASMFSLTVNRTKASSGNSTPITYHVHPHTKLAFAATGPTDFLTPSECVAAFGMACYTPTQMRTAYTIPSSLNGAGQTIVIVVAYGSPTIVNDVHSFDQAMGLPDPTLNIIFPGGRPTFNPLKTHAEIDWATEASFDVEWSHALAPAATIDLVIAANNGGNVLNLAESYVVQHHLGNIMSLSFGAPEAAIASSGNNLQLQQAHAVYEAAQAAGITVVAASGDWGATNSGSTINALYPASDPLVTAVGGTTLFLSDSGAYQSEDAWNDSNPNLCPFGCTAGVFGATGGAPSKIFSAPAYQQALSGRSARTTADVGYNASVYTGILLFLSFPGLPPGFYLGGGTSEGAPQWAAIIALADQAAGHALGFINPALYGIGANPAEYAADFQDVTVGDNGFFGPGFSAGAGYDLPTGLGTPNVTNLIGDLI